jgi:hypothetical protein
MNGVVIHWGNATDLAKRRPWERSEGFAMFVRAILVLQYPWLYVLVELRFHLRQDIIFTSHPHVQSWQQENAHD